MDGSAAIERNRVALVAIVASLVAMAGLAVGDEARAEGASRNTLPRHLWRAILRLLRPAEAAARRLIIAAAHGLVVPPPPPRKPKPQPAPADPALLLRRLGIAVTMSPAQIAEAAAAARKAKAGRARAGRFLPCEAGEGDHAQRGGGGVFKRHIPAFPLLDPLRNPFRRHRRHAPARCVPRILFPGVTEPYRIPPPPSPDDPISAARLGQRLAALAAALDDLPKQARRFARWKAARDAARPTPGRFRRRWPLRGGPPPGGRLARWDPTVRRRANIREIDEILAHAHALAEYALAYPDTS